MGRDNTTVTLDDIFRSEQNVFELTSDKNYVNKYIQSVMDVSTALGVPELSEGTFDKTTIQKKITECKGKVRRIAEKNKQAIVSQTKDMLNTYQPYRMSFKDIGKKKKVAMGAICKAINSEQFDYNEFCKTVITQVHGIICDEEELGEKGKIQAEKVKTQYTLDKKNGHAINLIKYMEDIEEIYRKSDKKFGNFLTTIRDTLDHQGNGAYLYKLKSQENISGDSIISAKADLNMIIETQKLNIIMERQQVFVGDVGSFFGGEESNQGITMKACNEKLQELNEIQIKLNKAETKWSNNAPTTQQTEKTPVFKNSKEIFEYLATLDGDLDDICEVCFNNPVLKKAILEYANENTVLTKERKRVRLKNGIIEFRTGDLQCLITGRQELKWIPESDKKSKLTGVIDFKDIYVPMELADKAPLPFPIKYTNAQLSCYNQNLPEGEINDSSIIIKADNKYVTSTIDLGITTLGGKINIEAASANALEFSGSTYTSSELTTDELHVKSKAGVNSRSFKMQTGTVKIESTKECTFKEITKTDQCKLILNCPSRIIGGHYNKLTTKNPIMIGPDLLDEKKTDLTEPTLIVDLKANGITEISEAVIVGCNIIQPQSKEKTVPTPTVQIGAGVRIIATKNHPITIKGFSINLSELNDKKEFMYISAEENGKIQIDSSIAEQLIKSGKVKFNAMALHSLYKNNKVLRNYIKNKRKSLLQSDSDITDFLQLIGSTSETHFKPNKDDLPPRPEHCINGTIEDNLKMNDISDTALASRLYLHGIGIEDVRAKNRMENKIPDTSTEMLARKRIKESGKYKQNIKIIMDEKMKTSPQEATICPTKLAKTISGLNKEFYNESLKEYLEKTKYNISSWVPRQIKEIQVPHKISSIVQQKRKKIHALLDTSDTSDTDKVNGELYNGYLQVEGVYTKKGVGQNDQADTATDEYTMLMKSGKRFRHACMQAYQRKQLVKLKENMGTEDTDLSNEIIKQLLLEPHRVFALLEKGDLPSKRKTNSSAPEDLYVDVKNWKPGIIIKYKELQDLRNKIGGNKNLKRYLKKYADNYAKHLANIRDFSVKILDGYKPGNCFNTKVDEKGQNKQNIMEILSKSVPLLINRGIPTSEIRQLLNYIVNNNDTGIKSTITKWEKKLGSMLPSEIKHINALTKEKLKALNSSPLSMLRTRSSFTETIKKVIEHLDCSTTSAANLGKAVRATPEKKPKFNWMSNSNKNEAKLKKNAIKKSTDIDKTVTGRYVRSKPLLKYVFYFLAILIAALVSWLLA